MGLLLAFLTDGYLKGKWMESMHGSIDAPSGR